MRSSRRLAPDYSFRFSVDDIRAEYDGSPDAAFASGDFIVAAQFAQEDSELKACALVLSGLYEQGLALLERKTKLSGYGSLCCAFAFWVLGRDADSLAALREISDESVLDKAGRLQDLVRRNNITVFVTGALIPIFAEQHSYSMLAPSYRYGSITAKYVASQMPKNAHAYNPGEPFGTFINDLPENQQPDLIFALSPQWLLAKDFHKVAIPKAFWCHDTDTFLHRNVENFALYDVAICGCSQEHFELSKSVGANSGLFVASNIMSNPLTVPFPTARSFAEKEFDVTFTGSVLDPFHSEKSRFMYQIAALGDEYKIKAVQGHLPEKEYFDLLAKSKFLPIVGRHAGNTSPRWRDALTNGACMAYPEGTLYGEIAPGAFPYRAASIASDIRVHLEHFDAGDPKYDPIKNATEINDRFAIYRQSREKIFERLLKYALFVSVVWQQGLPMKETKRRRLVWLTPGIDASLYGRENIRARIAEFASGIEADDLTDEKGFNCTASLHAQMALALQEDPHAAEWAKAADRYFADGLRHFPNSLGLRFNQAQWHFFYPQWLFPHSEHNQMEAVREFERIVKDFDKLSHDARGMVVGLPYTLFDKDPIFPYYEYADVTTMELVLEKTANRRGKDRQTYASRHVILAACHGYIGLQKLQTGDRTGAVKRLERAAEIYPDALPILRVLVDAMIDQCKETPSKALAAKLADAFFSAANLYPAILLTHIFAAVPLLVAGDQPDAARELLAGWYRLGNIVHKIEPNAGFCESVNKVASLLRYRSLFPKRLIDRVNASVRGEIELTALTQFEQIAVAAAKLGDVMAVREQLVAGDLVARDATSPGLLILQDHKRPADSPHKELAGLPYDESERLREQLRLILASRSWRMTDPLRRMWRLRWRWRVATLRCLGIWRSSRKFLRGIIQ